MRKVKSLLAHISIQKHNYCSNIVNNFFFVLKYISILIGISVLTDSTYRSNCVLQCISGVTASDPIHPFQFDFHFLWNLLIKSSVSLSQFKCNNRLKCCRQPRSKVLLSPITCQLVARFTYESFFIHRFQLLARSLILLLQHYNLLLIALKIQILLLGKRFD